MSHPGDDLGTEAMGAPSAAATITISLTIENTYEDGDTIDTHVTDAVIPAPPSPDDENAHSAWLYEHIFAFTGTGRTEGDAWYDVTVTACSDPTLVGQTYEFGY
ncbi:hypothetical protein [Actinoplanes sp. G11-F43]|uniref:hypothetical protein n=1 Tax=Actinoplanes sp. G11-F43 TaxID=3424130 RepID=UPI003D3547A2